MSEQLTWTPVALDPGCFLVGLETSLPERQQDLLRQARQFPSTQETAEPSVNVLGRRDPDHGNVGDTVEQEAGDRQIARGGEDQLLRPEIGAVGRTLSREAGCEFIEIDGIGWSGVVLRISVLGGCHMARIVR